MKECCTDSAGNPKKKYSSKKEAERIAQLRRDEGMGIDVYPCNKGDGWHLAPQNTPTPARPQNVMTSEDRRLCTEKIRKRLENVLGEAKLKEIKDEIRRNTLQALEAKVDQLEHDVGESVAAATVCRKEFAVLQGNLKSVEQDLLETRRHLSKARHDLEVARKRS